MFQPDDLKLVRLAQNGDVDAVGQLYDRHQLRIYRYVRARIFDDQTAQDLTGEVFLKMVMNLQRFRPGEAPFSAWLYRIARNLVINHGQKQQRIQGISSSLLTHQVGPSPNGDLGSLVESRAESEELARALALLETTQREVLILRFLSGLSLREVASVLEKSVPSIKAIQFRGLKAMRGLLAKVAYHA